MDGFKNIEIRNFRGIDHLEINGFSRVNVFLGQNSSGKSSVLECLLLMMGMSNPNLPQTINSIRSRGFSSFADLGYLNIVAASANPMNNILLIDEIENGFHYSAYKKLWEAIFNLATTTNKQVFVTTHSKETLCCLKEMLEENAAYQNELRLYTLENTKLKGYQAYRLTYDGLHEACTNDIELRSIV